ncbi:MAG: hypothetical protein ACM3O4_03625 [Ignavibacteriales bacterium]
MIYIKIGELKFRNVLKNALLINGENYQEHKLFDFSETHTYDPFSMLFTASTIRENGKQRFFQITYFPKKDYTKYAGHMGFFKSINPCFKYGKMPGQANGSKNYIPITKIDILEEFNKHFNIGDAIEKKSKELAEVLTQDTKLWKVFAFIIREIIRNSVEHSGAECVWICAQYWPCYQLAEIAILDNGKGVKASLKSNRFYAREICNDRTALKLSLLPGITEKFGYKQKDSFWVNSGFGLYMASQLCCKLKGSFCIVSGDTAFYLQNDKKEYIDTLHKGTAIRMTLRTDIFFDYDKLISETLKSGTELARKIKYSIKKASESSGGLNETTIFSINETP